VKTDEIPAGDYCYDNNGQCHFLLVPRSNNDLDKCLKHKEFVDRSERGKKPIKLTMCKEYENE
jgi:hypothetical protein